MSEDKVVRMSPRGGYDAKGFIELFLEQFGGTAKGVMIIGVNAEGETISGWSREVHDDPTFFLGALEQVKIDFWNTMFEKRIDHI